jgi:hypothetical protein
MRRIAGRVVVVGVVAIVACKSGDLVNVGGGTGAPAVRINAADTSVFVDTTLVLTATAVDAAGQVIPGAPVTWTSLDTAVATVARPDSGRIVVGATPGTARIVARLGTAVADTATVHALARGPALRVTTTTTGVSPDSDGYVFCVDPGTDGLSCTTGAPEPIGSNGTVTIAVDTGTHVVQLAGVAPNCAVAGDNPRSVPIGSGPPTPVAFAVACVQPVLRVTTTTTGQSPDPDGYTVCTDPYEVPWDFGEDCTSEVAIGTNATVTLPMPAGNHAVELDSVAPNCTLSGSNPREVTLGDTTDVSFAISCAPAGTVRIRTVTSGVDVRTSDQVCLDPTAVPAPGSGFTSYPRGCAWVSDVGVYATVVVGSVTTGSHLVYLTGPGSNCLIAGGNSRAVTVAYDDTVDAEFDVSCTPAGSIAFSANGTLITESLAPGGTQQTLLTGSAPAWSPDGLHLAYECGPYICVAAANGSGSRQVTLGAAHQPAWSPDGTRIAFAAAPAGVSQLYVMAPDGSGVTRLTDSTWFVGSPAWSPDGTKIAFDCSVDAGNDDICVVNADGSGFTRLTSDPARDYGPAWKPDGALLAFATTRFGADEIAFLNPGDGGVSRIGTGLIGSQPAWSPDGIRIAYVTSNINCSDFVAIIRTDDWSGNGVTCGQHPAWHP